MGWDTHIISYTTVNFIENKLSGTPENLVGIHIHSMFKIIKKKREKKVK